MRKSHSYLIGGLALFLSCLNTFAGNTPEQVSHIANKKQVLNPLFQKKLRQGAEWTRFAAAHPEWMVSFNESTKKPHRAYGKEIPVNGATAGQKAINFINTELSGFLPQGIDYRRVGPRESVVNNGKFDQVNFHQYYQGLRVRDSRITVKLAKNGGVIMYGLDVYENINLSVQPGLTAEQATEAAKDGLTGVLSATPEGKLEILPVPQVRGVAYHLVYQVMVNTSNGGMPGKYLTLVDASSGQVLYRQNTVYTEAAHNKPAASSTMVVHGTVSADNLKIPAAKLPLVNLKIDNDGDVSYTDKEGTAVVEVTGQKEFQIPLEGKWVKVQNLDPEAERMEPTLTLTIKEGSNDVDFDAEASEEELSAYYNVNIIHDFQKTVLHGYEGLDAPLTANVDIQPAICNAYYDGQSINFFKETEGCASLVLVSDVVFHEYGHGINDFYYRSAGSFFNNGAMHEGYADFWSLALNQDPILADGYNPNNLDQDIRRYDREPKVYPDDIVSEPHGDGEIICGAWWDTHLALGQDITKTMELWAITYDGLQAEASSGMEGQAFTDVLIDLLQADDDDNNLGNGTPNGIAITTSFRKHGITLLTGVEIDHDPIQQVVAGADMVIIADLVVENKFKPFVAGLNLHYSVSGTNVWQSMVMSTNDKVRYTAAIPGVSKGSVVKYYMRAEDSYGGAAVAYPLNADRGDLPFFTMVGFEELKRDDADQNYKKFGPWKFMVNGDDAVTGTWERCKPIPMYDDFTGLPTSPDVQTSQNGSYCYTTQNPTDDFEPPYYSDVDAGRVTLESPVIDMSAYTNPTISYNRWYTNSSYMEGMYDKDLWEVQITNNNWATIKTIDQTFYNSPEWKRNVFRVKDYIKPTDKMKIRFVATDKYESNGPYLGASLVEGGVDDIVLYESDTYNSVSDLNTDLGVISLFPNPTSGVVNVTLPDNVSDDVEVKILSLTGSLIESRNFKGDRLLTLDLPSLEDGMYLLEVSSGGRRRVEKFSLIH